MGLSSILTSSSSLGGVTGRGKVPNNGFCVSAVVEFAPKVKTPGLAWGGSPNCGAAGFSGEEGAPNLKVNENPAFAPPVVSFWAIGRGLAVSPKDEVGADCSVANNFGSVAPNPANGVAGELPNENIDGVDPFRSESVGLGSVVETTEGTFLDSVAGLMDGKFPN